MDQKELKAFIARRHPQYADRVQHWNFLKSCYDGGRDWFAGNIFRYLKEGDREYKDRLERAYRFNHTKEVVDLVDKYLFKMEVTRDESRAPESVVTFWKNATLHKLPVKDFSRRVSNMTSIFGRVWVVVDSTNDGTITSVADQKKSEARTYAYIVPPQAVLDMSYDEAGELNWILIHEVVRNDTDPFTSNGAAIHRYRLWTRQSWQLFTIVPKANDNGGKEFTVEAGPETPHTLGAVPVFPADNVISEELYSSPSLIDDISYLDRAVANYLSNLDAIIQDQTFSQLAMPAQGMIPGDSAYDKVLELGTKRIFIYDGEGGTKPEYLSPDIKQAEIILKVINKIINEIYHTVGLAGERTKEDNSMGIDNSSGVAKAYDFERVNSLLASKADALETIENNLVAMVAKWNGEDLKEERLVQYPDNFDVRGLYDEFEIAAQLVLIEAPDTVRRTQMDAVIDKLFPKLKQDLRDKMTAELKTWPPKIDPLTGLPPDGAATLEKAGKSQLSRSLAKKK